MVKRTTKVLHHFTIGGGSSKLTHTKDVSVADSVVPLRDVRVRVARFWSAPSDCFSRIDAFGVKTTGGSGDM